MIISFVEAPFRSLTRFEVHSQFRDVLLVSLGVSTLAKHMSNPGEDLTNPCCLFTRTPFLRSGNII